MIDICNVENESFTAISIDNLIVHDNKPNITYKYVYPIVLIKWNHRLSNEWQTNDRLS